MRAELAEQEEAKHLKKEAAKKEAAAKAAVKPANKNKAA